MNYLIVGASGAAGQSAVETIRKLDKNATITATSSREEGVPGADKTIPGLDLNKPETAEALAREISGTKLRALIYTPALGPLGYPISATPEEDIKISLNFSVAPMKELSEKLKPELTIGYSAFYWLPHTLAAYGSMAYAKISQEKFALDNPDNVKMIRAGTFLSKATRGIGILLQRSVKKSEFDAIKEMGEKWKASGKKFGDFFFDFAFESEKAAFQKNFETPHQATDNNSLNNALEDILNGEKAPIVNVIGNWKWTSNSLPDLPPEHFRLLDTI